MQKLFPTPRISSILFWSLIVLLLSTLIFLPLSSDQAIYLRGGEMLLNGGKLYHDYVDVKPPLLFYVYAVAVAIFGSQESSIRIADFLWQLMTVFLLFRTISLLFQSPRTGKAVALAYSLTYMMLGLGSTMHCETLAAPALVLVVYYHLRGTSWRAALLTGILCGFMAGLKTTLIISIPALLTYDLLVRRKPQRLFWQRSILMSMGALFTLAAVYFPTYSDAQTRQGYADVLVFTAYYASQPPLDMSFIRTTVKNIGSFFGDMYTLTLTIAAVIGFGYCFRENTATEEGANAAQNLGRNTMFLALTLSVFLLLSVIAERKFLPNHFTRMYVPLAIAVGFGGLMLYDRAREVFLHRHNIISRAALIISLPLLLLFSPLPRMSNLFLPMIYRFISMDKYYEYYNRDAPPGWQHGPSNPVISYLHQHRKEGERFLVSGTTVARLYLAAHEPVWSAFGQSTYYYGQGASPRWLQRFHEEVQMADWILVFTTDRHKFINGHDYSSLESIERDKDLYPYFSQNFSPELRLEEMTLYHRIRK